MGEERPLGNFLCEAHLAHFHLFFVMRGLDDKFSTRSSSPERLQPCQLFLPQLERHFVQAIVVLMRPTLVKSEILASSMPKAGVSSILSFRTFEHLVELYRADTYSSPKGILGDFEGYGVEKTALVSEKM